MWRSTRSGLLICFCLAALFFSSCATLPPRPDVPFEPALPPAELGMLTEISRQFQHEHEPNSSGFKLLIDAQEALEARLALIDLAQGSIDIQTFIWSEDATGGLLFQRLLAAADRGVRVRIIVDDIWLTGPTKDLVAINEHPNLKIRLFNPNPARDSSVGSLMQFLASFKELNRRMHNKLMIVDNHVLIAGGRNIGDAYFGLSEKYNFFDIDVLAVGSVIEEASRAFDDYWNHDSVYPLKGRKDLFPKFTLDQLRHLYTERIDEYRTRLASYPLEWQDWSAWATELSSSLISGEAHFLQDDPVHIDGESYRLIDMIRYLKDPAEEEFILATPYLIPVGSFLDWLQEGVEGGIRVRIVTNSLGSTNHTLVNSHYQKYRRPLLATGTELYEFHHEPSSRLRELANVEPVEADFISLHAKVFISDSARCFIGSLNFDPRALVINSENGLLIISPELSDQLRQVIKEVLSPENSWQVTLEDDRLRWQSAGDRVESQPARSGWQRINNFFGRLLPIEDQL